MTSVKPALDALCPAVLRAYKARIEASPLGYRLAKGAFWSLAGSVISRGLGLLASILVARILGKAEFGQLGMVQSTIGMFGTLAGFGMGFTANKHVAEFRMTDPLRAGRIIGLSSALSWASGGIMTLVLVALAPWLASHTLAAPEMGSLLRMGALLLLLGGVNGAQTGALAGFEAFKTIARVNLVAGALSFPMTVAGALVWGVSGAISAMVINLGLNCVLNYAALRKESARAGVPLGYLGCLQEWPLLWRFSLPALMAGAMQGPVTWLANALLVNQPNGYAEMGAYNAVMRIQSVPTQVLWVLLAPLLPVLSYQKAKSDATAFQKAAIAASLLALGLTLPFALTQMAAPALSLLPFGHAYAGHGRTVQWLMLDLAIVGVFTPAFPIAASTNRLWLAFSCSLGWSLVFAGLAFLLVPRYGSSGLAAALALSHLATTPVGWSYLRRQEKALLCGIPLGRIAATTVPAGVVCFGIGISTRSSVGFCLGAVIAAGLFLRHRAVFRAAGRDQANAF
jgi:O-antigen/teichoic acid export membrane protein